MQTIWGTSQTVDHTKKTGVVWVTTAGHGGVRVSLGVAMRDLSERARKIGYHDFGCLWFEEDCDWAAVAYEHAEWFTGLWEGKSAEEIKQIARGTLERWHPEYFEQEGK